MRVYCAERDIDMRQLVQEAHGHEALHGLRSGVRVSLIVLEAAHLGAVAYYGKPVSSEHVDELLALVARCCIALAEAGLGLEAAV
jgi:hypothetical protein